MALATEYELMDVVLAHTQSIVSTQVIATKPQEASIWPGAAFVWEASDPYLYVRATHDGRVICGGEDEDFQVEERRDALIPAKTALLAKISNGSARNATRRPSLRGPEASERRRRACRASAP